MGTRRRRCSATPAVTPSALPVKLGNTRAVAKGHHIGVPETVPDNRDVLERWTLDNKPEV
ncbi:hypothetical protein [Nocardia abscessus]|uniref:hypothetical protein n=1 Tax=Nocardia abscessus TaxID=120957 RepID=UPI0024588C6C|nr:hypothetical protein [Nocardia abscessus]